MATPPVFVAGEILTAAQMNAVGLWETKSQTIGTTVSSVTVTDAFTSDFSNYRIIISGGVASTSSNISMTLTGIAGAFIYRQAGFYQSWGTATITAYAADGASWIVGQGTTDGWYSIIDITSPNLALRKFATINAGGTTTNYVLPSTCTTATASTGFTITPGSGTLTGGVISVYGYNK
jgi:hypothetical protein